MILNTLSKKPGFNYIWKGENMSNKYEQQVIVGEAAIDLSEYFWSKARNLSYKQTNALSKRIITLLIDKSNCTQDILDDVDYIINGKKDET